MIHSKTLEQDYRFLADTRDLENEVASKETARLREINADLLTALVLARTTLVNVQDVLEDTVRFPELIKLIDAKIAKAQERAA